MKVFREHLIEKEIYLFPGSLSEYQDFKGYDTCFVIKIPNSCEQFVEVHKKAGSFSLKSNDEESINNINILIEKGLVALVRYNPILGYGIPIGISSTYKPS